MPIAFSWKHESEVGQRFMETVGEVGDDSRFIGTRIVGGGAGSMWVRVHE